MGVGMGKCDDPAGRHLGWGGLTNPRRRNSAGGRCTLSRRTGPGVQRPEAPTTSKKALSSPQGLITPSTIQLAA